MGEKNAYGTFDHLITPLVRIPNNYPKLLITFDSESKIAEDGTIILNALEFLMGCSWKQYA